MSDHPDQQESILPSAAHRVPHRRRRGCVPVLVVLLVIGLLGWFGGNAAYDAFQKRFGAPPDYEGAGTGQVVVEVQEGASATAIGQDLRKAGVVKSVRAFTRAAAKEPKSRAIQVGFYTLRKKMPATKALAVLIDPTNLVQSRVQVREGARVKDVVRAIVAGSDFTRPQVLAAMADPNALGLPPEAGGRLEGYLFPATYNVPPDMTVQQLLTQMIAKTRSVEQELGIAARAQALGYDVRQIMTMASLLEYEGSRDADLPKIARVFYNRLDKGMRLQSDATVAYANNLSGTVWTSKAQRNNPSPYNTYAHEGLPPGPIGSPGKASIEAALNPASGNWLFFVPVNLRTGETVFSATKAEHDRAVQQLKDWCARTKSENCS